MGNPWDINTFKSINSVQKYCRETAKKMMMRSNAYSNLIRTKYPNYIRLSIHGHDNSKKFAICFYKTFGLNYCITPWHNVTCKMLDGRILLFKYIVIQYIVLINKQLLKLQIDSKLSIYSRSKQVWFDDGIIDDIIYKNGSSEWLIIKYNNNKNTKQIQRFSSYINPIKSHIINAHNNGKEGVKETDDKLQQHPIDIKHHKQYKKIALNFNEWSVKSTKSFKIIYKENRKWYYQEI